MTTIRHRRIGLCILFSILTFGIYYYYWYYLQIKNVRTVTKDDRKCTAEMLCLIFVPFYSIYWWYTRGKDVEARLPALGYTPKGTGFVYLLLNFVGLNIISMALMQNDFNQLPAELPQAGAQPAQAAHPQQPAQNPYAQQPARAPYQQQPGQNPYAQQPARNPYQQGQNPYAQQPARNPYQQQAPAQQPGDKQA